MINKLPFGRTGHLSTRVVFGATALSAVTLARADRTMEALLYYGINHIDIAAGDEESEKRVGAWMKQHAQDFFLALSIKERTSQKAREELLGALSRLGVEQVDLLNLYNLTAADEWKQAMGPGGALQAAVEAREQGLIRFIGVTGHGVAASRMHKQSLKQFDFDAVSLPYNYPMMQNTRYAADFKDLMILCHERDVAVQGTKAIARGNWGNKTRIRATWYEPLEAKEAIDMAIHWALSRRSIFLITPGDIQLVPKILEAATHFRTTPTDAEMDEMVVDQHMSPLFT